MRNKTSTRKQTKKPAFTLLELLAVIAVISILMTAGAIGIGNISGGTAVGSSVSRAESIFNLARATAIANNTDARVLVSKKLNSTSADRHPDDLRRLLIVYRDSVDPNKWLLNDRAELLSGGVYFSQEFSKAQDGIIPTMTITNELPAAYRGEYFYYEFNSEGVAALPGAGFVVGSGIWRPKDDKPRVSRPKERDFAGFVIWRNGRTSIYRSVKQIPQLPGTNDSLTNF